MSTFVEQAACRGRHPQGFSAHQRRSRPDLVARLLRQRRVPRFIVAPGGFGKSYLAYDYAHVVFSFNHVFWISGRSPCFLRDIDANSLCAEILRVDREPSLVVFEDLPPLDETRVRSFVRLVSGLLSAGNEVIVTCTPPCDAFASLLKDRMLLGARDLLLDEEEARAAFIEEAHERGSTEPLLKSELVPCLRWNEDGASQLMIGLKREELLGEDLAAAFTLLLLQRGKLSDVEAFVPAMRFAAVVERLAARYPFLGIDVDEGVYEAARIDVGPLHIGFGANVDELAELSSFETREAFVLRCADALMVRGLYERAVGFTLAFSTKRSCALWLAARGWELLAASVPKAVADAYIEVERSVSRRRITLYAILSWAFLMLDSRYDATSFARKAAFSTMGEPSARAVACVVLLRLGEGDEQRQARSVLEKLLIAHKLGLGRAMQDAESEEDPVIAALWPSLAHVALCFFEDVSAGVRALCELLDEVDRTDSSDGLRPGLLSLAAAASAWTFDSLSADHARVGVPEHMRWAVDEEAAASAIDPEDFARIVRFSCMVVEHAALVKGSVGWFELRLAGAIEHAYECDPITVTRAPSFTAMSVARRAQLALFAQCDAFRKSGAILPGATGHALTSFEAQGGASRIEAAPAAKEPPVRTQPPVMRVSLFGTFEVRIGEEMIDPTLFSRQKMRTLLAILVLNRGKEFTRESLSKMLWPNSSERSARKSFYSLWSRLRRVLQVDGECPYLIRDQYGCRVNARLVISDVMQFEEMCRMLLFGRTDERGWEHVYAQVSIDFAEVLLPGETTNDLVLALRGHYHTQLVDALIAASSRMVTSGEIRGALWFAREALRRDRSREDAYVAQMEAQIAAEQRAAALETFFSCRRFLASELGIDPSVRIVRLYRAIIESEEEFA